MISDPPQSDKPATEKLSAVDLWLRRGWPVWLLASAVFACDQITKLVIIDWLRYGESWPVEGFLRFTHARNTGAAFSLFEGQSTILSIVAILAIGLILWLYKASGGASLLLRLALALQLGGAFGNLLDRFRYGYVVDFVDVGPWPIFNVADSAISVGIAFLIAYVLFGQTSDVKPTTEGADTDLAPAVVCQWCEHRREHIDGELPVAMPITQAALSTREASCITCSKARSIRAANRTAKP